MEGNIKIPIIDVSGFYTTDEGARQAVVDEFKNACTDFGFMQIVGHKVPTKVVDDFMCATRDFFSLPISEKEKVSQAKSPCSRGYEALGGQALEELESLLPDQKESFGCRADRDLGKFLQGRNQWPQRPEGFREAYEKYYAEVHSLCKMLFRIMALSLDLNETYFDEFASDPDGISLARSHHYPPAPVMENPIKGVGAHTDFGAMTLLLQDMVGGLQVMSRSTKKWINVPCIEGGFVVNLGDIMARWTNNRYKSTLHRVLSNTSGVDRYSCAFFNEGKLDQIIECIPSCLESGQEPLYEPIKMEDHLRKRYIKSYGDGGFYGFEKKDENQSLPAMQTGSVVAH